MFDSFDDFLELDDEKKYEILIEALASRTEHFLSDSYEDKMARAIIASLRPLCEVALELDKAEQVDINMLNIFVQHMTNTQMGLFMIDKIIAEKE